MKEFTAAERTMLTALASEVVTARLARAEMGPGNPRNGHFALRVPGPETAAEVKWFTMLNEVSVARRAEVEARLAA